MALATRQQVFTFTSTSGSETYTFDIVLDFQGGASVRNIRDPRGATLSASSNLPGAVLQDIQDAMDLSTLMVAESTVVSGTETFTGQTQRTVAVAPGLLNNTSYRVHLTPPDSALLRVENRTTTSFDIVASSTYGAVAPNDKDVAWAVLVSTAQNSTTGGTLTFNAGEVSKSVTFASALASNSYRVLLEPSDFFLARALNKTTTGFTVEIGFDPDPGSVVVGYDVIV